MDGWTTGEWNGINRRKMRHSEETESIATFKDTERDEYLNPYTSAPLLKDLVVCSL